MDPSMSHTEAGVPRERPPSIGLAFARPLLDTPDDELADAGEPETAVTTALAGTGIQSLDNPALAVLIGRVVRQDEAALALLHEQLCGRVYAVALRITREVGCAEEVLQDTFWQVWRQAPRFDPLRGSAVAWVLMMARSRALDAVRARSSDPVQTSTHPVDDDNPMADEAAGNPMDLLQAVRRDTALHAQLALLDPLRRQMISLAFFRGLTHDEIAGHLGLPLGTVKSHFRRTLAGLQVALGPDFGIGREGGAR